MPIGKPLHFLPLTTDCSGWATICAKWSGAQDPNGRGYDGAGYTGTLLQHLWTRSSMRWARPGDLCVFGEFPGIHVVILLQNVILHPDPLICSHGWEGEPLIMRFSQQAAGFPGKKQTFLNLLRDSKGQFQQGHHITEADLNKGNPSVYPDVLKQLSKGN